MKTKIENKKFVAFLKSKRLLQKFERNCKNLNPGILVNRVHSISSFEWAISPEGYGFWHKLHREFAALDNLTDSNN